METDILNTISSNSAVMLYFKNETCQPCKVLRVKVENLIKEAYPKIVFHLLEIENYPDLISRFNVMSSPTMILFLEGREYFRGGIYTSITELDEKIGKYYNLIFNA
jgi:thioredoxin 1